MPSVFLLFLLRKIKHFTTNRGGYLEGRNRSRITCQSATAGMRVRDKWPRCGNTSPQKRPCPALGSVGHSGSSASGLWAGPGWFHKPLLLGSVGPAVCSAQWTQRCRRRSRTLQTRPVSRPAVGHTCSRAISAWRCLAMTTSRAGECARHTRGGPGAPHKGQTCVHEAGSGPSDHDTVSVPRGCRGRHPGMG